MKTADNQFNNIVESVYDLSLEHKEELKDLLQHNISDTRRTEIAANIKKAQKEHKSGKLKFSSSINSLKKLL